MTDLPPALAMLAAFALAAFGARAVWLGVERRRGVLMLAAAAVLVVNVLIWTA